MSCVSFYFSFIFFFQFCRPHCKTVSLFRLNKRGFFTTESIGVLCLRAQKYDRCGRIVLREKAYWIYQEDNTAVFMFVIGLQRFAL